MIIQKTMTAAKRFRFEYKMSLISLFWEIKFNLEYSTKTRRKKQFEYQDKVGDWLRLVV